MANILTQITDELISLIETNYPRFKDVDRIKLGQQVELENLGYEDTILIHPLPTDTQVNLTSGKISDYALELIYYKKVYENELETVSDFAESLDNYLLSYIHHGDYWLHLSTIIDYDMTDEIPDEYGGRLSGFTMLLTLTKYKAG